MGEPGAGPAAREADAEVVSVPEGAVVVVTAEGDGPDVEPPGPALGAPAAVAPVVLEPVLFEPVLFEPMVLEPAVDPPVVASLADFALVQAESRPVSTMTAAPAAPPRRIS